MKIENLITNDQKKELDQIIAGHQIPTPEQIKHARQTMKDALKDPGLYLTYQANIAMTVHDEIEGGLDPRHRNLIADKILKLLFEIDS